MEKVVLKQNPPNLRKDYFPCADQRGSKSKHPNLSKVSLFTELASSNSPRAENTFKTWSSFSFSMSCLSASVPNHFDATTMMTSLQRVSVNRQNNTAAIYH
jgi:hypothetical protein